MLESGLYTHSSGGNVAAMAHPWTYQSYRPATGTLALHIVPGLEQILHGQRRKGLLLMSAAAFNVFFLSLLLLKNWLLSNALTLSQVLHTKVNTNVVDCLRDVSMRSPQMVSLCTLLAFFIYLSIKDAKVARPASMRIYPASILEISEAASGSYVIHACMFVSMLLLVLFLIVPPAPHKQVMSIEFPASQQETKKVVQSQRKAENATEASGHKDPAKPVAPSARAAQQTQQRDHARTAVTPQRSELSKSDHSAAQPPKQIEARSQKQSQPLKLTPTVHPPAPAPVSASAPVPDALKPVPPQPHFNPQPINSAPTLPTPVTPGSSARVANPNQTPPVPKLLSVGNVAAGAPAPNAQALLASAGLPAIGPLPSASATSAKPGTPGPISSISHRAGSSGSQSTASPQPVLPARGDTGSGADKNPTPVPGSQHTSRMSPGDSGPPAPTKVALAGPVDPMPHAVIRQPGGDGTADSGRGTTDTSGKRGPVNVDTSREINWGPYMADLQRRIKHAWTPPKYHESNRVVVIFKIRKNGELSNLKLSSSSRIAIVDQAALQAVENAAPFKSLPAEADDDIDVQFTFDYNLNNPPNTPNTF